MSITQNYSRADEEAYNQGYHQVQRDGPSPEHLKLPIHEEFSVDNPTDSWSDELGDFTIITKDNSRYCRLLTPCFVFIYKMNRYDSEYKRQRYSQLGKKWEEHDFDNQIRDSLLDNNKYKLHTYNTRSSEKYTDTISIELLDNNLDTISYTVDELIWFMCLIYPDLDKYYQRPNHIENYIDVHLLNDENRGTILKGGVSSIARMLITGSVFRILDEIEDYNQPEEELEDVHVTMTSVQYKSIIGTRKATIKDTHECCAICCDEIKHKTTVSETLCGHVYHSKCLRKWITKECRLPTCPTCRADLRVE